MSGKSLLVALWMIPAMRSKTADRLFLVALFSVAVILIFVFGLRPGPL